MRSPCSRLAPRRSGVPSLRRCAHAAAAHGVSIIEDDLQVSLGEGVGSRCWPRDALPAVDAVNWRELRDIPTVLVTGSNGKTTTVRLIAAMAAAAGMTPGLCSTEGIVIGGKPSRDRRLRGSRRRAHRIARPKVEVAILETARGGILRRGLALQRADAAIVTNISPDHLGEYGVDGADDLAETKLVVAHAVEGGGTLIVNADDAALSIAMPRLPHAARAQLALFAADYDHPALAQLRARSGSTCGLRGEQLLAPSSRA